MIIIGNGRLITRNAAEPYYENGAVVTENELIKETGTTAEMRLKYPDAEFVDAKGDVIMPAFINAHTHIYSALARGLSIAGYNPTNFYEVLDGIHNHNRLHKDRLHHHIRSSCKLLPNRGQPFCNSRRGKGAWHTRVPVL